MPPAISSYSVYPLYSPYRLVIDCVKEATPTLPLQGRRIAAPTVASLPPAPALPPALPREVPVQPLQGRRVAPPTAAALPRAASPPLLPRETPLMPLPSTPIKTRPIAIVAQTPPSLTAALEGMVGGRERVGRERTSTTVRATTVPATTTAPVPPQPTIAGGFSMARQLGLGVSRIVIDPGHGGHDPGGAVRGITEAELVLDVALRLEKLLEKVPGVEVILTRRTDEFVPLQERTAIANREGADLFLSIHANANANTRARRRGDLLPELRHQLERGRRSPRARTPRPARRWAHCPTS